jgi:hypothetical protein
MKSKGVMLLLAGLLVLGLTASAWADNPDDVSFSGFSATVNGSTVLVNVTTSGGAQTVALPYDGVSSVGTVAPGDSIAVTFSVGASGGHTAPTTWPRTVGLAAVTHQKPTTSAPDVPVGGLAPNGSLTRSGSGTAGDPYTVSTFQRTATFTAPSGHDGAYILKITGTDQASSGQKLNGRFFYISFDVLTSQACTPAPTTLTLNDTDPSCVLYHATSVTLSAKLTTTGPPAVPLSDKTITFNVDGASVGTGVTNGDGLATLVYDPSSLGVGNHSLSAAWQSFDECLESSTATGGILGIQYLFKGFQPPINADGSTVLTGKCGPVKIVILDANGVPVSDATALVFFEDGIPAIVGTDPENATTGLNFDYENVMRYSDDQYVYNWDLSSVTNGTKTIRVFLGEGSCAPAHQVVVSVGKKKK